jgi:hypothetical protein
MHGCTYTCRHVPAMLNERTPLMVYPVRFTFTQGKAIEAALCSECLLRIPYESELCRN